MSAFRSFAVEPDGQSDHISVDGGTFFFGSSQKSGEALAAAYSAKLTECSMQPNISGTKTAKAFFEIKCPMHVQVSSVVFSLEAALRATVRENVSNVDQYRSLLIKHCDQLHTVVYPNVVMNHKARKKIAETMNDAVFQEEFLNPMANTLYYPGFNRFDEEKKQYIEDSASTLVPGRELTATIYEALNLYPYDRPAAKFNDFNKNSLSNLLKEACVDKQVSKSSSLSLFLSMICVLIRYTYCHNQSVYICGVIRHEQSVYICGVISLSLFDHEHAKRATMTMRVAGMPMTIRVATVTMTTTIR